MRNALSDTSMARVSGGDYIVQSGQNVRLQWRFRKFLIAPQTQSNRNNVKLAIMLLLLRQSLRLGVITYKDIMRAGCEDGRLKNPVRDCVE